MSRGLAVGDSARQMATRLGRAASTVSREIARNGGRKVTARLPRKLRHTSERGVRRRPSLPSCRR
ncbi:helix-turn-helix domain-containing protein [Streptomyces sp. NPDC060028]|uniref:helix-turn-helix domain-containing protein n=1 Tax=Streptomyces sp. NPDC060028 TaxID=3347041 RepID=UPI00369415BC